MFSVVQLDDDAGRVLAALRDAGVVLDYVWLTVTGAVGLSAEELHRAAVGTAVAEAARQRDDDLEVHEPAQAVGRPVTRAKFFGTGFDAATRGLLILDRAIEDDLWDRYGTHTDMGDIVGTGPPPEWRGFVGPLRRMTSEGMTVPLFVAQKGWYYGYADLFLEPPYSLGADLKRQYDLFLQALDTLIGPVTGETEIWRWDKYTEGHNSPWSDYFHEDLWWGERAYTLRVTPHRWVAICASSAD